MSSIRNFYRYLFRKHFLSARTAAVLIISYLLMDMFLSPVRDFAKSVDVSVSPWGAPLVLSGPYIVMVFMLLYFFWISDFPVTDRTQLYIVNRIGIGKWIGGQTLYILSTGFFYILHLWLGINLLLLPVMKYEAGWGKVFGTLSQPQISADQGILLEIPYRIISNYDPLTTNINMLLICSLVTGVIGVLVLSLNAYLRMSGIVVGTFISFFCLATRYLPDSWHKLSPLDWMQIDNYSSSINKDLLSYPYVYIALSLLLILFTVVSRYRVEKMELGR